MTGVAASCRHRALCCRLIISDSEVLVGTSSDFVICGATRGLLLFELLCATVTSEQSGSCYKPGRAQPNSVALNTVEHKVQKHGRLGFLAEMHEAAGGWGWGGCSLDIL